MTQVPFIDVIKTLGRVKRKFVESKGNGETLRVSNNTMYIKVTLLVSVHLQQKKISQTDTINLAVSNLNGVLFKDTQYVQNKNKTSLISFLFLLSELLSTFYKLSINHSSGRLI